MALGNNPPQNPQRNPALSNTAQNDRARLADLKAQGLLLEKKPELESDVFEKTNEAVKSLGNKLESMLKGLVSDMEINDRMDEMIANSIGMIVKFPLDKLGADYSILVQQAQTADEVNEVLSQFYIEHYQMKYRIEGTILKLESMYQNQGMEGFLKFAESRAEVGSLIEAAPPELRKAFDYFFIGGNLDANGNAVSYRNEEDKHIETVVEHALKDEHLRIVMHIVTTFSFEQKAKFVTEFARKSSPQLAMNLITEHVGHFFTPTEAKELITQTLGQPAPADLDDILMQKQQEYEELITDTQRTILTVGGTGGNWLMDNFNFKNVAKAVAMGWGAVTAVSNIGLGLLAGYKSGRNARERIQNMAGNVVKNPYVYLGAGTAYGVHLLSNPSQLSSQELYARNVIHFREKAKNRLGRYELSAPAAHGLARWMHHRMVVTRNLPHNNLNDDLNDYYEKLIDNTSDPQKKAEYQDIFDATKTYLRANYPNGVEDDVLYKEADSCVSLALYGDDFQTVYQDLLTKEIN